MAERPSEQERPAVLPVLPRTEAIANGLRVRAPAKLNLNLLVGLRRADGFHDLDSVVAKVTLYDEIELRPRGDGQITFSCTGADCGSDERNLALLAARLLAEETKDNVRMAAQTMCRHGALRRTKRGVGVDIALSKRIPPGKGLGGGSSDAAAVLMALNELWDLRLPQAELSALAAELGSDVPLFLGPPTLRITGRGERVAPARVHPFLAVLYLPGFSCPTAEVYRSFDELAKAPPAPRKLGMRAVRERPPSRWRHLLRNDLAPAARRICRELGRVWDDLARRARRPVQMTGSGSALFVLCDDEDEAAAVLGEMPQDVRRQCLLVQQNRW